MDILTARTTDGQLVILSKDDCRISLRNRRDMETFYCPQCKKPVHMKVGDFKVPHFAHAFNSSCQNLFAEGESAEHLLGKQLLYEWLLQKRKRDVVLEPVMKAIQQRPDLLVTSDEECVPIEFQCSTIPVNQLQKRTDGFRTIGMNPIWILQTPISLVDCPQGVSVLRLSKFQEWFTLNPPIEGDVLLTFYPHTKTFHYYHHLLHLAGQRYIGIHHVLPMHYQVFPLARPKLLNENALRSYADMYKAFREDDLKKRILLNRKGIKDPFLLSCYKLRILPVELPLWIGVPTKGHDAFREADYEWQLRLLHFCKQHSLPVQRVGRTWISRFVNQFSNPSTEKVEACRNYSRFLRQHNFQSLGEETDFSENEVLQIISERFLAKATQN
ncbi:competence protein CoiA [Sporosarcina sp. OR05]|uniref:competence protein CoiA n=1 Tax=Sporosarcina sp. OR05 TaxID=2969819 RepID=UPI00352B148A